MITFKPKGGNPFTIGGQAAAPAEGVAGPFANLSISKDIRRQDNLILGATWTINITGIALITDAASHLVKGERQGKLFELEKKLIFSTINQQGTLDITAYGGTSNMQFLNAILTSVEAADQDESSMGTQNQPYTFTFVSSDGDGTLSPEVGKGTAIKWIESFDESWDVSVDEGTYSGTTVVDGDDVITDIDTTKKTYTISHSISAQAVLGSHTEDADDLQMSYLKAKAFVEERLVDNPMAGAAVVKDERGTEVELDVPADYTAYNHVRQRNQAIAAGSYGVTDTWIASKFPATYTVDYSFNGDDTVSEFNTVEVSLSAEGYDTKHPESSSIQNKYTNALTNWDNMKTAAQRGAAGFYTTAGGTGTLRTGVVMSTSETHNKTDGSLSFSCTFDDATINYGDEAVTESLNISYNNVDGGNQIVAIIPVIAKVDGPVIQDMGTTNEKIVSVSLDLVLNKANRVNRPDKDGKATTVVTTYKPVGANVYRRSKSENWNPYNGNYSLAMEWVYIDGELDT